jgi:hypothetical protein
MTNLTEMESKTIISAYVIGKEFEWVCNLLGLNTDEMDVHVHASKNGDASLKVIYKTHSWERHFIKEDRFLSLEDFSKYAIGPLIKQIIKETDI